MTLQTISNQLFNLSLGGHFNGEKFSRQELTSYISAMFRTGSKLIMEICLPDGRWFLKITKYADRSDGYDYYIPDTREQEALLKEELFR